MTTGKFWGYWIFPDAIPQEKPMKQLAKTMTEQEVDEYYYRRGQEFIKNHLNVMPGLWVGKLVRAYIPIPWKITLESGVASLFRWILFAMAMIGIWRSWYRVAPVFRISIVAIILTNVFTVLESWGCARFSFQIEPFLIPFAAIALFELYHIGYKTIFVRWMQVRHLQRAKIF